MSFGGLILTNGGRNELAMAETGKQFRIESVVFGDGTYNGSYMSITSLVNQVMVSEAQITRKDDEVYVDLEFSSKEVPRAFFLREIGIIANGALCYYDNCGQEAEYIDPESDSIIKQKRMRFILKIASEVSVNTTIDWQMYAKEKDLQALTDAVLNQATIEDAFKTVYPEIAITTAANPKKIGIEGLAAVWKKAYSLMKLVTGAADAGGKGSLQEQINSLDNKKADKTGDLASAVVTFSSGDSLTPTGWANVELMASKETLASLMRKASLIVKNVRYLYKMLGTTDISALGGGTVTGAIGELNSNLGEYFAYEGTNHNLIVPVSVLNMNRAQLEATDIPEGYYTVINLLKHPDNAEGVQYAIGYFGGDCVGKMFYRTFANHQVTSQFKEVALDIVKANKNGTESINVSREVAKDDMEAFAKANFIASKPQGSPHICGYGFHNAGINGCFLYYSETDEHLHILNNVGHDYVISMAESK